MNQIDLVKLNEYTINLIEAAREYLARNEDKNRVLQQGCYVTDEGLKRTWIPFANEVCICCRTPNGKMSGRTLQNHFRSANHVAALYKVGRFNLLKLVFIYEHMLFIDKNDKIIAIKNMNMGSR